MTEVRNIRKVVTKSEEYSVYDCPLCGKPVRIYTESYTRTSVGDPCHECIDNLEALRYYEDNSYLLGAVIVDFETSYGDPWSLTITTKDGKEFIVSPRACYDGGAELEIEEVDDSSK